MPHHMLDVVRRQPIALVALFVALGGTSFAATRDRGGGASGDVIHGCVGDNTGRLRIVDSAIRCGRLETPIAFDREGRRGERGPRGLRGPRGSAGAAGAVGATGAPGHDGATGAAGAGGPAGKDGAAGATGKDGLAGSDGAPGKDGLPGSVGAPGKDGLPGSDGAAGKDGAAGATGPAGPPGSPGTDGKDGKDGANGSPDTALDVLGKLKTVDGVGSGLDADTVRGQTFEQAFGARFFSLSDDNGATGGGGTDCTLGAISLTAATFPPVRGVWAAGQTLPIASNAPLFALLGTNYGGNGTTNFRLPDLRGLAPAGTSYAICTEGVFPSRG